MTVGDEHAERFTHLRPLLFTIVYEILGSATESDDVLQDSYLRWAEVDLAGLRDTKSYLAQLVTRQALNALRAGARRREDYVGPWLPEPLLLDERDACDDVVLAESVSMAMLVLLETLRPDERAVFVLREVFGFGYDEIASAVGKRRPRRARWPTAPASTYRPGGSDSSPSTRSRTPNSRPSFWPRPPPATWTR
jgi:RNA polymerase sigma-70 factor (ECF subfamily)